MAHKPQDELSADITKASANVAVGATYTHYKNPDQSYKVLYVGVLEASDEPCVIYQAEYGDRLIFVRAVSDWLSEPSPGTRRFTKI